MAEITPIVFIHLFKSTPGRSHLLAINTATSLDSTPRDRPSNFKAGTGADKSISNDDPILEMAKMTPASLLPPMRPRHHTPAHARLAHRQEGVPVSWKQTPLLCPDISHRVHPGNGGSAPFQTDTGLLGDVCGSAERVAALVPPSTAERAGAPVGTVALSHRSLSATPHAKYAEGVSQEPDPSAESIQEQIQRMDLDAQEFRKQLAAFKNELNKEKAARERGVDDLRRVGRQLYERVG